MPRRLVELARDLLEPGPRRREPPLEVGDALGDLLLAGREDRDLPVGGPQVGARGLERRLEPRALGGAPGSSPLLEVDGVPPPPPGSTESDGRRAASSRARVGVRDGDDVRDVDRAEAGVAERLDERTR